MDEVAFSQLIQNGSDRLATRAGQVGDVLLGEVVIDERFVADFSPVAACRIEEKLDNSLAGIFQDERIEAGFHPRNSAVHEFEEGFYEAEMLRQQLQKNSCRNFEADDIMKLGLRKIWPQHFAGNGRFAKNGPRLMQVLDDFAAIGNKIANFQMALKKEKNALCPLVGHENKLIPGG